MPEGESKEKGQLPVYQSDRILREPQSTDMSDGEILPFSDIDCDAIRSFLQRDLLRMPEVNRDVSYGRAIARVLAHELYHIFVRTTKHAAQGIGKPSFTVQELL